MLYALIGFVSFIAGCGATAAFGSRIYADGHKFVLDEMHTVEARWPRLIVNMKTAAHKTIEKV